MKLRLRTSILATVFSMAIVGCSSGPLQSGRLDNAEEHITRAQAQANQPILANETLGTATAFLATVKDNKFRLTEQELARYEMLLKRSKMVSGEINR